jgi:hypothetical protein
MPMPGYYKPHPMLGPSEPPVKVELKLNIEVDVVMRALRAELAKLLRQFSDREAGPVGIRLKQVADVFEEAA